MLGAKIGEGAHISLEAEIAEFDLVTIGDYAKIEYSTVRGFGLDNGLDVDLLGDGSNEVWPDLQCYSDSLVRPTFLSTSVFP